MDAPHPPPEKMTATISAQPNREATQRRAKELSLRSVAPSLLSPDVQPHGQWVRVGCVSRATQEEPIDNDEAAKTACSGHPEKSVSKVAFDLRNLRLAGAQPERGVSAAFIRNQFISPETRTPHGYPFVNGAVLGGRSGLGDQHVETKHNHVDNERVRTHQGSDTLDEAKKGEPATSGTNVSDYISASTSPSIPEEPDVPRHFISPALRKPSEYDIASEEVVLEGISLKKLSRSNGLSDLYAGETQRELGKSTNHPAMEPVNGDVSMSIQVKNQASSPPPSTDDRCIPSKRGRVRDPSQPPTKTGVTAGREVIGVVGHLPRCHYPVTFSTAKGPTKFTNEDVLIGRYGYCRKNGGNELLRGLVEQWFGTYEAAEMRRGYMDDFKVSKRDISDGILASIHATGGRFLKALNKQGDEFEIVTDDRALRTIVARFTELRRRKRSKMDTEKAPQAVPPRRHQLNDTVAAKPKPTINSATTGTRTHLPPRNVTDTTGTAKPSDGDNGSLFLCDRSIGSFTMSVPSSTGDTSMSWTATSSAVNEPLSYEGQLDMTK